MPCEGILALKDLYFGFTLTMNYALVDYIKYVPR
jgi:hypothetical protein